MYLISKKSKRYMATIIIYVHTNSESIAIVFRLQAKAGKKNYIKYSSGMGTGKEKKNLKYNISHHENAFSGRLKAF